MAGISQHALSMRRHEGTVVARRAARRSHEAIGFAVRDAEGRGGAYAIDPSTGEALVFGATSALRVRAAGVLPAHFVVLPHAGMLVAASASPAHPAILNGAPLPTTWTVLDVPSRVRIGAAAVDFFYLSESGTALIDQDVETTVALGPMERPTERSAPRIAIRPNQVPRRARAHASMPPVPFSAADLAASGTSYVRMQWSEATMSTRVLLGVVAILVIFLFARGSGERGHAAPAPASADDETASAAPRPGE